jgi:hypothetical protein
MRIVKIYGGLGNQMFQYAFARSLAAADPDAVYIDSSSLRGDTLHNGFELERLFGIELPEAPASEVDRLSVRPRGILSRALRKYFTKRSHVIDKKFGYQAELLTRYGDTYFEGYWQSEKYFAGLEEAIRLGYTFRETLDERNLALLRDLPRPIASVHVRRGDYLQYPNLDICGPGYYERAAEAMRAEGGIASFLILSDDIEYCRTTLRLGELPAAFVDWNRGDNSWQDMAMMASCDHNIIANSSFGWWGAWLNPSRTKRVIAPSVWNRRELRQNDHYYSFTFGDIVPDSWERVAI